jgi:hypothetical protein
LATQELSSETLSALSALIREANATLHAAEEAQHRRHELALRRRTLLVEDVEVSGPDGCILL